jgi:hypothetical protein
MLSAIHEPDGHRWLVELSTNHGNGKFDRAVDLLQSQSVVSEVI